MKKAEGIVTRIIEVDMPLVFKDILASKVDEETKARAIKDYSSTLQMLKILLSRLGAE